MAESIIQKKSFAFALEIIQLYRQLQQQREYIISTQLLRSYRVYTSRTDPP